MESKRLAQDRLRTLEDCPVRDCTAARTIMVYLAIASVGIASPGFAQSTFVDTFEGSVNQGGWTFSAGDAPGDTFLQPSGGNPGGYSELSLCCDFFPPRFHTLGASEFTGDFRAERVIRIAADLRTFAFDELSSHLGAPLNLKLETDAGTANDASDDFAAYFSGDSAHSTPLPGDPWQRVSFDIPSAESELPADWMLIGPDPIDSMPPKDSSWMTLIRNVSGVSFEYGPPNPQLGVDTILHLSVGIDNAAITRLPEPSGKATMLVVVCSLLAASRFGR